jgi:hypothetical protein
MSKHVVLRHFCALRSLYPQNVSLRNLITPGAHLASWRFYRSRRGRSLATNSKCLFGLCTQGEHMHQKGLTIIQLMVILLVAGLVGSFVLDILIDKRCESSPETAACKERLATDR